MNGQTARGVRRDLRRAFGGDALATLDRQAAAIHALAVRIDELARHAEHTRRAFEARLASERLQTRADTDAALLAAGAAEGALVAFRGQTLGGRLRWLLTGM